MATHKITEIPNGWKQKTLKDLIEIRSGVSPSNFNFVKDGKYPFFKVNDMNFCNKYLNNAELYFNVCKLPLMTKDIIVFPKRGAAIFTNKIAILGNDGFFDTNIMGLKIRYDTSNVFLYYYLNFLKLYEIADTSSVPQINNKHIDPLIINYPPIAEQKKIAIILSTVDDLIDITDHLISSYTLLKKGLMQTLLTKGIGHTKFKKTEIGEIPKEWELKNFCECIKKDKNRQYNKIFSNYYLKQGKYPIIDQGKEYICGYTNNEADLYTGKLPVIIFGDHTRIFKYVDMPFAIGADGTQIILPNNKIMDSSFFFYTLSNLKIKNQGYQRHYKYLKEFSIPIPKLFEQQKIVSILSTVDNRLDLYKEKKEKLQILKKGLMQQLLTGKIRVKV